MSDRVTRDDFERIRLQRAELVWPEPDLTGGGVPAFVGQVTSTSANIGVGKFLLVRPVFVMGDEAESSSGNFATVSVSTVPVYLVGPGLASTGDYLICKFVDHRWVTERTTPSGSPISGGGPTVTLCFCENVPTTLTMTSLNPLCNYGMFQSCTLQFGPIPSVFEPLDLGTEAFISLQSFPDPIAGGALFQYYLSCLYNVFSLTRIYPSSPYGSPYIDGVLYTWYVGSYGNTCSPFYLGNGTAYLGTGGICSVTIDS
jgi:hypothetical protein